ncbi:MAG TPA: hypothetical protein VFJ65_10035 [Solirubrobacterales bacterium]|nr:hypothetical protein [Solirubrobacterales bacterium]
MSPHRRVLPLILACLTLVALAVTLSACGWSNDSKEAVEGESLQLGELKYIVTFSRYLNPNDTEDAAYLEGAQPAGKGESYFGIFFEIQNESDEPQKLPSQLTIEDADGNEYGRIANESIFGLPDTGEVEPEEQIPVLDSPAQQGPIEGAVAVFLLPEEASENRPLTLLIATPEGERGEVTLDL